MVQPVRAEHQHVTRENLVFARLDGQEHFVPQRATQQMRRFGFGRFSRGN
jgi:hypothetical protein